MTRLTSTFAVAALIVSFGVASAQEPTAAGARRFEISAFPGGGILFTEGDDGSEPDFGNYALGGSLTANVNRFVGVEGEVGGGIGVDQRLEFANGQSIGDTKPPHMLAYNANLVVSPAGNNRSVVPYVTGGVGGLTLFEADEVGVDDNATFLTGNVGGGVKWLRGRWGLRGDYRFITVDAKDDAPAFFGQQETRYGHRIYGGIILNFAK